MMQVLEFELGATRYGLPVARVVEVVPRVWLTPLPAAAPIFVGAFNYRGAAVVAVDLRARFGLPARPPSADDHLLGVRGAQRVLALVVDRVCDLREVGAHEVQLPPVPLPHVRGVVPLGDGLLLLEDLDALLGADEESSIDRALPAGAWPR